MSISVIIPCYRAAATLRRAVDSALTGAPADLEVLLVDDGSPDDTGTLCDELAAADPRVRTLHRANGGAGAARNTGLDAAHGDWVLFLDADDALLPGLWAALDALTTDAELRARDIEVRETAALFKFSGGDARKLLNILEILVGASEGKITLTDRYVTECLQQNIALYDKNGEQHYDVISAFIKSVRGSDPNAAIYYLARMLAGGEEPRFIARRLVILASEDIGLANPNALLLANACFDTVHKIGMPEARITLAETTIYLATSPKSNSAYMAINRALAQVGHDTNNRPVPLHLRNAPTRLMEREGYGKGYKYAHDYEGNFAELEFMPQGLEGTKFYEPDTQNAAEAKIAERIHALWKEKYR